ncbi:jerky protein homolog-like [Microplitis mediator]|uniref:jerky protein homolog-like n=1 Tax=Microplitis mediator TaxID=375433 RepID=UPI0025579FDC|nr:jerky protein homolog-like [Microplitis mediator]
MNLKRKRKVLTLREKLDVILSIDEGKSGKYLSRKFEVGSSTISDIKKKHNDIIDFSTKLIEKDGNLSRKIMKGSQDPTLDNAVFEWFTRKRTSGQPISGSLLCEKARSINQTIDGNREFQASRGWLERFKSRHGIRVLRINGEKLSADSNASSIFVHTLKSIIDKNGYTREFIYNVDETRLNYKALPIKSLVLRSESAAPGYKSLKEFVTIVVCANASGTHRLPLFIIGKSRNQEIIKHSQDMPVIYKYSKKAWMNREIFTHWFRKIFITEVQEFQSKTDRKNHVLLILDNAPCHPPADILDAVHETFRIKYLPPNVTSIIQPMDQDDNNCDSIVKMIKDLSLRKCFHIMADAWNNIDSKTIVRSWNKIFEC